MSIDKEELEHNVVLALVNGDIENSYEFVKNDQKAHLDLIGVINSLQAAGCVATTPSTEINIVKLTPEGENFKENGSLEARFYNAIDAATGSTRDALMEKFGKSAGGLGLSYCMRSKWIKADKSGLTFRAVDSIVDQVQLDLIAIVENTFDLVANAKTLDLLKKRNLVENQVIKTYRLTKGPEFTTERKEYLRDLDMESLKSGKWKEVEWKEYNFEALGKPIKTGALHPLQKVRSEFRTFLVQMGFQEMESNSYVESSFWNFDSLFQPQQHPARDAHDTFFLSHPEHSNVKTVADAEYFQKVKDVHEHGGYGSIGYGYNWKAEEASKNILRTHTTSSSSRILYKVAEEYRATGIFTPRKYFSIDRVFRNETLDATHLAEFHQVEGLVADRNLTLGHLIGTIKEFFLKIGIEDVRFKPAYNPYTEPSMEIFGYSKDLGKWMEIGNSGMFRPEMLQPMGLPEDVRVIAWGLSLERPTMIKYGLNNIRDLVGPRMQLKLIEKNPIARY